MERYRDVSVGKVKDNIPNRGSYTGIGWEMGSQVGKTMTPYFAIAGTWNANQKDATTPANWIHPDSAFSREMALEGLVPTVDGAFQWSTDVDGIFGRDSVWEEASHALAARLAKYELRERNLIAHSHGGTVAIFASTLVPINRLVTLATPVRKKTLRYVNESLAMNRIQGLWHLHELNTQPWSDWPQWLGSLFDGSLSQERRFLVQPLHADKVQNIGAPGINHSHVLNDPAVFQLCMVGGGITAFLRGTENEPRVRTLPKLGGE